MSDYKCMGCGSFIHFGEGHTCAKGCDPVPVEGAQGMKVIVGVCTHTKNIPYANATNGESGILCQDCGRMIPVKYPILAEGVVLPIDEVERFVPGCGGMDPADERDITLGAAYVKNSEYVAIRKQLAEAIAQRDAARKDVALLAPNHPFGGLYHALTEAQAEREKACNAVMTMQLKLDTAEIALAAMTEDRNLWQNAHDEDCPNNAALAAERARVLQEAADALSHGYANARAIVLNMIDK